VDLNSALRALRGEEDVPAQIEQTRQLVSASGRFTLSIAGVRGQPAPHEAHAEECKPGHQVLVVADDKGADRRQEEVVEGEHCDHGRRHRRQPP
jgi:hypothetical protein